MNPFRIAALGLLMACSCSRSVPPELPREESPIPRVGAALAEDPPLDGGSWPGLGNAPPSEHHHHAN